MNQKPWLKPTALLTAALVLGVLGDVTLRAAPPGLGFALWFSAFVAVVLGFALAFRDVVPRDTLWLIVLGLHFALAIAWRDSPAIAAMNVLALLAALSVASLSSWDIQARLAGAADYLFSGILTSLNAAMGFPELVGESGIALSGSSGAPAIARRARAGLVGAIIGAPLVLMYGSALASADAAFERTLATAFSFDLGSWATHGIVSVGLAWIVGGYLRGLFWPRELDMAELWNRNRLENRVQLGIIEVGIPLAAINAMFLLFVIIQVRYLFGDHALIEATTNLTYAQYARRGFFELVFVSAVTLPVLLASDWYLRRSGGVDARIFKGLCLATLALLTLIMASALKRMLLYQNAYGLTELRVYTTAFMFWLGAVFVWFAATVLRSRRPRFAFGALILAFATVVALNVINIDALIVRTNASRAASGERLDVLYATSLSADAVPSLMGELDALPADVRCLAAERMIERWSPQEGAANWRSWNLSRARAQKTIATHRARLEAMICPPGQSSSNAQVPY